ncbi:MAG: KpsF/GutQ family sugar-phosphate isomerase [Candidatus Symbiodolus clandestinus]
MTSFEFQQWGQEVLTVELDSLQQLRQTIAQPAFIQACEQCYHCRGKIVVLGVGKSGHIACKIAATLASTGTPAFFIHPSEASHGDLGMISATDCLLLLSYSGEAPELLNLLAGFRRLSLPTIAITGNRQSTLAQFVDIHLDIGQLQEACSLGLAPTSSTTATLVLGDALAVALLRARGFTQEDFARSHPGGRLGRRLLLQVRDVMRQANAVPIVAPQTSLREALLAMTRYGLGMTIIGDDQQPVQGVFTDGDLRRVLDQSLDLNHTRISEVMTSRGQHIKANQLAVEALNFMQGQQITTLLVMQNEQLIGVVQLYDLLKAGVV